MSKNFIESEKSIKTRLFDEKTYSNIEKSEGDSLRLLANCVVLANATILRERKLLPDKYFHEYPVYGNVTGYMVNDETIEGRRLAAKLAACREPIEEKLLHKLAIVVEETLNTKPVEAFIWSFSYNSPATAASAEIGFRGESSKFTVDYSDMNSTCQQFCKLFNKLQEILMQLNPLPAGMVPSMKVAYRGDPEFIHGFERIDEFVKIEEIRVEDVVFPHDNRLQLSYRSKYEKRLSPQHNEGVDISDRPELNVSYDMPEHQIETLRQETMRNEGIEKINSDDSVHAMEGIEGVADVSVNCNPNNTTYSAEKRILQSEDQVHETGFCLKNPRVSKKQETSATKESVLLKKPSEKRRSDTKKKETVKRKETDVLTDSSNPKKKKCSRRLVKEKNIEKPDILSEISIDNESDERMFDEALEERELDDIQVEGKLEKVPETVQEAETMEDGALLAEEVRRNQNLESSSKSASQKKKKTRRLSKLVVEEEADPITLVENGETPTSRQSSEKFGRVRSLTAFENTPVEIAEPDYDVEKMDPILRSGEENVSNKYGKSTNIVEEDVSVKPQQPAMKNDKNPEEVNGENFARVPSLLDMFGQLTPMQFPLNEDSPSPPGRRSGRVSSVLALTENMTNENEPANDHIEADQHTVAMPKKYGHSSSILPDGQR